MSLETEKEIGLKKLEELRQKHNALAETLHTSNEATTRLLIIDEVLKILGWEVEDFNPESYSSSSGYSDYLLKHDGTSKLVIEAKRVGLTFGSPKSHLNLSDYSVSYFKTAFKTHLTKTIEQATKYCVDNGVSYALVTNGREWIALQLVVTPGKSIDSMKGIYYGDIFSQDFYFDHFWNTLSKAGLISGELENYLNELNYTPSSVSKIIKSDYSDLKWGNFNKENLVEEYYESFFSQITDGDKRKMLDYCFVSDSKLSQYKGDLKRILKDKTPRFLPNFTEDLEPGQSKEAIINDSNSGKVIIITGSVGCGKTTLVQKSLVEAKIGQKSTTIPILVDLINDVSKTTLTATNIILERINRELLKEFDWIHSYENLIKIYKKEISVLKNSSRKMQFIQEPDLFIQHEANLLETLKSDTSQFVIRALKGITSKNTNAILIIDNVDRASEEFQEEMYAIAHKISSESGATVIITMREFTFFKNKSGGFLDVRSGDRVIHLKAPDFGKLVSARIKYIETHFDDDYRVKQWRRKYGLENFKSASLNFTETLKNSLQRSSSGSKIIETLSCVSWHNIRYFCDLIKKVHIQLGSKTDKWKHQEVLAALMVNQEAGEPKVIPNIFTPYQNINRCYFLKIRIIFFLMYSIKANDRTHGIPKKRILGFAKMYGYRSGWILAAIEELVRQRFIECLEIPSDSDDIIDFDIATGYTFRISPLGAVFQTSIMQDKIYLALISADLPFHTELDYERVKEEYDGVFSYMGDKGENTLFKDGIDFVVKSKLSDMVSEYLTGRFNFEKLLNKSCESISEVSITEDHLKVLIGNISSNLKTTFVKKASYGQLYLSLEDESEFTELQESSSIDLDELIPEKMDERKYQGTEYIPLIICALVIRKVFGHEYSFGTEITECINRYIVSVDNAKFPNNVSRALRSNKLLSQKWLTVNNDQHVKFKAFSLSNRWEDEWKQIFKEDSMI
ncbi:MAG: ABC-type lipoprotein export system ATPase subunit [Psychroserpens sp.]|jgi:ABC-type lipoprotein export system ATPase subunit